MKVLIEYGFRYALEVGFNPKRNAGNNNSGNLNRMVRKTAFLSPAGE
ncbi:MAG: hypothetical protein J6W99_07545 [Bacteroidaceae bacterium]|nr:hypothetical protein [Bacteroidaceae bacterium]